MSREELRNEGPSVTVEWGENGRLSKLKIKGYPADQSREIVGMLHDIIAGLQEPPAVPGEPLPVESAPVEAAPVESAPAEDTPTEDTPTEDAALDAPVESTPVEKILEKIPYDGSIAIEMEGASL